MFVWSRSSADGTVQSIEKRPCEPESTGKNRRIDVEYDIIYKFLESGLLETTQLATWVGFNVILPLIPVFFARLLCWFKGNGKGFLHILGDGQICFVCTAMVSTTLSDTITHMKVHGADADGPSAKFLFIVMVLFIALTCSTLMFGLAMWESDVTNSSIRTKISSASLFMSGAVICMVLGVRAGLGL